MAGADSASPDGGAGATIDRGAETPPKRTGGTSGTGANGAAGAPETPAAKPESGGRDRPASDLRAIRESPQEWKTRSIHELTPKDLDGEPAPLAEYADKVLLIVNLASRCGLTPQYAGLQKLYEEFKDRGLVVLGFPCNDFGNQEPGSPGEIREFCTTTYGVTFPLFEKVSVKPGDEQAPLYAALQAKTDAVPRWNFGKYLVSADGVRATYFDSRVLPESPELREAIEKALKGRAPTKPEAAETAPVPEPSPANQ